MKKFSEIELWKDVSPEEWKNWKWQLSHCINTLEELEKTITISDAEAYGIKEATKELKMRISPHIALMMANGNHEDTLRKQFIPSYNEVKTSNVYGLYDDVNDDDGYSPVKGLVHRYPTKVLIFPSNFCGCYCRY